MTPIMAMAMLGTAGYVAKAAHGTTIGRLPLHTTVQIITPALRGHYHRLGRNTWLPSTKKSLKGISRSKANMPRFKRGTAPSRSCSTKLSRTIPQPGHLSDPVAGPLIRLLLVRGPRPATHTRWMCSDRLISTGHLPRKTGSRWKLR